MKTKEEIEEALELMNLVLSGEISENSKRVALQARDVLMWVLGDERGNFGRAVVNPIKELLDGIVTTE